MKRCIANTYTKNDQIRCHKHTSALCLFFLVSFPRQLDCWNRKTLCYLLRPLLVFVCFFSQLCGTYPNFRSILIFWICLKTNNLSHAHDRSVIKRKVRHSVVHTKHKSTMVQVRGLKLTKFPPKKLKNYYWYCTVSMVMIVVISFCWSSPIFRHVHITLLVDGCRLTCRESKWSSCTPYSTMMITMMNSFTSQKNHLAWQHYLSVYWGANPDRRRCHPHWSGSSFVLLCCFQYRELVLVNRRNDWFRETRSGRLLKFDWLPYCHHCWQHCEALDTKVGGSTFIRTVSSLWISQPWMNARVG